MTSIAITFTSLNQVDNTSFLISIDNALVDYNISDSAILIDCDLQFGFHMLEILPNFDFDQCPDFKIQFTSVIVDGSSIRQLLYLSFCEINNKRLTTVEININRPNWNLPFGTPTALWVGECARTISNSYHGHNLEDHLEIFYPPSIELSESFPPVVRDFFKYDYGFCAYNKKLLTDPLSMPEIPFIELNFPYDENALYAEFMNNIHIIENKKFVPAQQYWNEIDAGPLDNPWAVLLSQDLQDGYLIALDETLFPEYFKLRNSIEKEGIRISAGFIGSLHPGGFIAPHTDQYAPHMPNIKKLQGCSGIFIPIGWKPGNYFKFSNVGLLPTNSASLYNPTQFVHASVNQSDSVRFSIGIGCEFSSDAILKYVKNKQG